MLLTLEDVAGASPDVQFLFAELLEIPSTSR